MPSASAKLEKQMSTETYDPVKQVLTIVEKKVRNLEKRKGKLDAYRQESANGKELNDDQKKAVEKYDQVVEVLEFTKELQKQFQTVIQDCSKAQKKAAKREQLERQQNELQRIKEIVSYQDLLNSMGSEDIRNDFLNGNNGACKLTEEELNSLDELYKAICPERDTSDKENASDFDEMLSAAAEHIQALLDSKNKEVFGTTYKALKEILLKIQTCSYFSKNEPDIPNEEESSSNVLEEKETAAVVTEPQHTESSIRNEVLYESEEAMLPPQGGLSSQVTHHLYQTAHIDSSSLYPEKTHPIQEVLSMQGNLNFLQESQIELESSRSNSQVPTAPVGPSYPNVQYSTSSQSMASSNMVAHCTRQPSGDAASNMVTSPATSNLVLTNSASLQPQQQVGPSIPANVPLQPTTQAIDFVDPARPIPTQTFTNQSFSSAIHPMMAAAVSQNFVPVVTLPHAIPPAHVLTQNMVVQPLPPRSTVASSLPPSNPNMPLAPTTPELNTSNNQSTCIPTSQFECGDVQETYQSTNNSQGYVNRDSFTDNSSYSSNLKRGLNSRGGARGNNTPRGSNAASRGTRSGYRN